MSSSGKENSTGYFGDQESSASRTNTSPPKSCRSAFMLFSESKRKVVAERIGCDNHAILMHIAEEWRLLTSKERAMWEEAAREDKRRYAQEKISYKGPLTVKKRRAKKHPYAPKRPPSAFLKFSQKRRPEIKRQHPELENTDISRLLGEEWRNAHPDVKAPFVQEEKRERAAYKDRSAKFREGQVRLDAASRTSHRTMQRMIEHPQAQAYQNSHHANIVRSENIEPFRLEHDVNSYHDYRYDTNRINGQHSFHSHAYKRASTADSYYQAIKDSPSGPHQDATCHDPAPLATRPLPPPQLEDAADTYFPPDFTKPNHSPDTTGFSYDYHYAEPHHFH